MSGKKKRKTGISTRSEVQAAKDATKKSSRTNRKNEIDHRFYNLKHTKVLVVVGSNACPVGAPVMSATIGPDRAAHSDEVILPHGEGGLVDLFIAGTDPASDLSLRKNYDVLQLQQLTKVSGKYVGMDGSEQFYYPSNVDVVGLRTNAARLRAIIASDNLEPIQTPFTQDLNRQQRMSISHVNHIAGFALETGFYSGIILFEQRYQ